MPEVKQERTGWRDEAMSNRHRDWGFHCPAVDIDFLMVEYDTGRPVALVEYKQEQARMQDRRHANYKALVCLGNDAGIAVFACRYAEDFTVWRVVPLNLKAREYVSEPTLMTEEEWVTTLYRMRGRPIDPKLVFVDGTLNTHA